MEYRMVRAEPHDLEQVLALLVQAAQWLRSQGLRQWSHYLNEDMAPELAEAIAADQVYLALAGDRPVGTISLQRAPSEWDRTIWGAVASDEAVYVHRLAVHRTHAGRGVGAFMLDWAENYARQHGYRYLRLDCVGHNERLNAYYQLRFTLKGHAENIGMTFSRYERQL